MMNDKHGLSKEKFREILNDAEVNYKNLRYLDAAKTFEYLSDVCMEQERPEDMVYFQYRTLLSHKIVGNIELMVSRFQKLAINALRASTIYALSEIDSPHIENTIALLWYIQQNLKMLNDEEKRKPILLKLHHIFQQMLDDEDLDENNKLKYLDRSIELSTDLGLNDQITKAIEMKGELVESEAEKILVSNGYDVEMVAAHKFLEAAEIYERISEIDKLRELMNKAIELYPEINLAKYNLEQYSQNLKTSN